MKKKEIMPIIAIALAAQTLMFSNSYASEIKLNEDKIVGKNRYETAIEVSKKGWPNGATNAVIVNDTSIVDALSATPFANAKNAPILLTKKDTLNEETKQQLKILGVKNVYIIGGESAVSKKIEEQLKTENINVDRIQGKNREATSIEIAKRLDGISPVEEVSIVNGYKGLADAVSIAAISANENMPIILSGTDSISNEATEFIASNNISKSYIVGGDSVVSNDLENKLPNATRIAGKNRKETNTQVINTFFTEKEMNNLYIAKDGAQNENQLIDALSVGSLAAKTNSPVMIVGSSLDQSQKDLINSKSFKTITQVGGNGNESSFNEIKDIQNEVVTEQKPSVPGEEPTTPGQVPSTPEQEPSAPVEKPNTSGKPEQNPSNPEKEPTTSEQVPSVQEKPSAPTQNPSTPVEKDPVYPENITLYNSRDGQNTKGLGDTTYDQLKSFNWNVESDNVVSAYGGKIKFENLHGEDHKDARITIKDADSKVAKDALQALTLMNGEESQYTPEQLYQIIYSGITTIKDGSRYIGIKYDGDIFNYTLTITFSNFGITPVHKSSEGTNKNGFGDTTYDELKKSGWKVDSNNKVSSSKGKVSFTNEDGKDNKDATIDVKNGFDKDDEDLLYALSLMLNSRIDAEKLANDIQADYNKGTQMTIISASNRTITVDISNKNFVKITFKNINSNNQDKN